MQVSVKDLENAINLWLEKDLSSKGTILQQGLVTFVIAQIRPKISEYLEPMKLLASKEGTFDKDTLHTNMSSALQKMGGSYTIPFINYTFDEADLSRIFNYIKEPEDEKHI